MSTELFESWREKRSTPIHHYEIAKYNYKEKILKVSIKRKKSKSPAKEYKPIWNRTALTQEHDAADVLKVPKGSNILTLKRGFIWHGH